LWVAELDSGRSEPLLPGFVLPGFALIGNLRAYDISADGREVVVASPDQAGKTRLWLAPLDRRSPPRQIPGVEGEQPVFAGGEVFFRGVKGTSAFLYRVREDGTGLRKAMDEPILGVLGVSADRRSVVVGSGREIYVIFRIDGAVPLRIPGSLAILEWSADGKELFVESVRTRQTYALPLPPGHLLPESFSKGFPSTAVISKLPGVRVIPSSDVAAGPTADVYAFTHETVQRNLYRIPLP
jgi:hypothetical protein